MYLAGKNKKITSEVLCVPLLSKQRKIARRILISQTTNINFALLATENRLRPLTRWLRLVNRGKSQRTEISLIILTSSSARSGHPASQVEMGNCCCRACSENAGKYEEKLCDVTRGKTKYK